MTFHRLLPLSGLLLLLSVESAMALKTDRQEPLEVNADSTDGTLGDGMATLQGNVVIRQGTLLIEAEIAEVEKAEGRARRFEFRGNPVHLQQEIENEGLVVAEAKKIEYEVATGIVTLTGEADVEHPQYHISGEVLEYDMNVQHFKGSGGEENGRIRIRLDPEVVPDAGDSDSDEAANGGETEVSGEPGQAPD
jgi:lipopolysaccharide export system protein LptA